ncbi:MAG: ATP-dependent Clp protease proteolytic subunit [Oscillospiraceae bacterium]|nr:ATP-dependent Clp protease proteolytic subunit [Oscillospiraceae bacterium]
MKAKYSDNTKINNSIDGDDNESQEEHPDNTPTERDATSISKADGFSICTILIAGHIEGHSSVSPPMKATKYERIIPELVAFQRNPDLDGLLIILNTVGGDVEAGLALAELVASLDKPTVSLVLGGGHSIGIPIAVAAQTSFIVKSATMTLHPVRTGGVIIGAEQSFEYIMRMQDRVTNFILDHSSVSKTALNRLIYSNKELSGDIGSLIDGERAVKIGLINKVGGLVDALNELKSITKRNKPDPSSVPT